MDHSAPTGHETRWKDLRADFMSAISSPLTAEVERFLLAILRFERELQLDEASEMPHRMSPEEMLKSLAVQALGRWTGATYLPTMRRLQATASPALSCVIRGVIQQVWAQNERGRRAEPVAEIRSEETTHNVKLDYNSDWHPDVIDRELGGRPVRIARPVCRIHGMTFIAQQIDAEEETRRASLSPGHQIMVPVVGV